MKKMFLLSISLMLLLVVAVAADRPVQQNQLPKAAQDFITKYFSGVAFSSAMQDTDPTDLDYKVYLQDGTEIEFDRKGQWKEVERKLTSLPESLIPTQIATYVAANFVGQQVFEIKKDRRGYDVKLSNGLELKFDSKFNFLRMDD